MTASEIALVPACSRQTEGTYLRHDPRARNELARGTQRTEIAWAAREFPNLPLKNSISRASSGDNWTLTFFNPPVPASANAADTQIHAASGAHSCEMRFRSTWPALRTRRARAKRKTTRHSATLRRHKNAHNLWSDETSAQVIFVRQPHTLCWGNMTNASSVHRFSLM